MSANMEGAVDNGFAPSIEPNGGSAMCGSNRGAQDHLWEILQKSDGDIIPIAFCRKNQVW